MSQFNIFQSGRFVAVFEYRSAHTKNQIFRMAKHFLSSGRGAVINCLVGALLIRIQYMPLTVEFVFFEEKMFFL